MLHSAPSFDIFHSTEEFEEVKKIKQEELEKNEKEKSGDINIMGSGEFTFGKSNSTMDLIQELDEAGENGDVVSEPAMYLATGLGFGEALVPLRFNDVAEAEEYYKRMVDENPSSALFLGNYARLLESKGDLEGAEDYYSRASFIDPNDGETLMLYARLVWQLHHDRNRAHDYFERAVLASPQDSDVLGAYAHFLWDIGDEKDDDFHENDANQMKEDKTYVSIGEIDADFSGGNNSEGSDTEEYHKRMVEENSFSSIVLRNYAQFLYKTKGDQIAAEDNYTKAIFADPTDGETKAEYAELIWEVHHDRSRALCCFQQALLASPEDSNVLAAYARFLWEAGESEEDDDT